MLDVPPDETGDVPVAIVRAEPRFYGVTPPLLASLLAAAALALAIVLFVTGHWPFALIALGIAILLLLVVAEAARRKPSGALSHSTAEALETFRQRAGVAAETVATRGRVARQALALRRELQRIANLRARLLFELGDAVYRGDERGTEAARERIAELDQLAAQREGEMEEAVQAAQQRLDRRRLEVQPTEIAERPQPQPGPQPGEGNPPEPARIPEPYPPPDEATPPQPAIIPEPGPAVIPEPGPRPPAEGERG